jgi:hypothetical protein
MSKKHYEAIAAIILAELKISDVGEKLVIEHLSEKLADYFKDDNPQFSINRFLVACGLKK